MLEGVHSGLLNKQIAYDLGIAEATVKAHMTALMRKLNVRNRTQVAIAAQALGYGQRIPSAQPGRSDVVAAVSPDGTLVALLDESRSTAKARVTFAPAST